ncbi:DUF6223 family protein [Actinoplanes regularis]|nr:DUF6223 family protein [Actinoplanes regularis]GIE88138.1 hypothetical protein Are01nite_46180 [Actinoplanes regularis]GLW35672.1 hypothetical protein Areg01_86070 [Actinoplanes regularis]
MAGAGDYHVRRTPIVSCHARGSAKCRRRHDARRRPDGQDRWRQAGTTEEDAMSYPLLLAVSTVDAGTVTVDRVVATAAALTALAGAVLGGLALARSTGHRVTRRSFAALAAGVAGALVGLLVVATADGGPGTGNGVVGGYAGVVFGLVAAALGGLALFRSRRRA